MCKSVAILNNFALNIQSHKGRAVHYEEDCRVAVAKFVTNIVSRIIRPDSVMQWSNEWSNEAVKVQLATEDILLDV